MMDSIVEGFLRLRRGFDMANLESGPEVVIVKREILYALPRLISPESYRQTGALEYSQDGQLKIAGIQVWGW